MNDPHAHPPALTTRETLTAATVLAVASGLPMGVLSEFLPVYLKANGASLALVGALGALWTPYTFKAAWSPVVERVGHARRWTAALSLGIGGVCAVGGGWGEWLFPAFFVVAVLSATQDVAIDGWVVSLVAPADHGRASGLRAAGYRVAMALTGGGAVWLAARTSWDLAWAAIGAFAVAVGLVSLRMPAAPLAVGLSAAEYARGLARWLVERREGQLGALGALLFALSFKLGDAAMAPMVKPFWLDAGLSVEDVGLYSVLLGSGLTAVGALVGGEVVSRLGNRAGILWLGGAQALSNVVYAAVALAPTRGAVIGAGVVESITQGLGTAPLFAVLMAACGTSQPTVRYALLTAAAALSRTIASLISGVATESMGYPTWFFLTALLAVPALGMAPWVAGGRRA